MKFRFLGGAYEVGKSSVLMDADGLSMIFDSGAKLTEPPTFPLAVDTVNAAFLSHAHLDHCGNMPALHKANRMPVYATPVTFELSHMLQNDSIKINKFEGWPLTYTEKDIARMTEGEIHIQYGKQYRFHNKVDFTFYDAGHTPGSAGILVEAEGKMVFYTGDTHSTDTRLQDKAAYPEDVDVIISETTYGDRLHPQRREVENQFLNEIDATLENEGVALVPVFAIGRTQEILLLLKDCDWPVYLDGMSRKATQIILKYPDTVKNHDLLMEAMDSTIWVKDRRQRRKICSEPGVIVTTAGMLEGGPVLDYLPHLHKDANSSIILTGYQVENTNGRRLVEQGFVLDKTTGKKYRVDMKLSQLDFSAHSDKDELKKMIDASNAQDIILMHGDPQSIETLKTEFGGRRVHTPRIGESIGM